MGASLVKFRSVCRKSISADPGQTRNQWKISSFLLAKRVVRVKLPCSHNQAPLHESTFFEFLCGILTLKYVAEVHLNFLFPYVKNSWKNPETNVPSFATYVFVCKFNNTSMSNTTDRYESSNVFTSRSTRTSRLMYSGVVRPVPLIRETKRQFFTSHHWALMVVLRFARVVRFVDHEYSLRGCAVYPWMSFFFFNARSAQKTSVFLVLKAPRKVPKWEKSLLYWKVTREVHK